MARKQVIFFIIISLLVFFVLTKTSSAEIATVTDWIGVFPLSTTGNTRSATSGGDSWYYTSSTNCSQTPGTIPKLEDSLGCTFSNLPKGAHELRLYANNMESSDALIAKSSMFWIGFSLNGTSSTPASSCSVTTNAPSTRTLTTTINWPTIVGANVKLNRTGGGTDRSFNLCNSSGVCQNTYTDTITSAANSYSYSLTATNGQNFKNSNNILQVDITGDTICTIDDSITPTPTTAINASTPTPTPNVDCPGARIVDDPRRIDIVDIITTPGVSRGSLFSAVDVNPTAQNKYSLNSKCLLGQRATLSQAAMPNYETIKLEYYSNTKLPLGPNHNLTDGTTATFTGPTSDPLTTNLLSGGDNLTDGINYFLLHFTGDVTINTPLSIGQRRVAVVFVDGNLNINSNITDAVNAGIVFIVGGDVRIAPSVNNINAFIVAYNQFCSNYQSDGSCSSTLSDSQLIINGSVIFLYNPPSGTPPGRPQFIRSLADNSTEPAEKVIFQPKYLVLLKSIFASNLTLWSEIQ